jgi:hypothetical protein
VSEIEIGPETADQLSRLTRALKEAGNRGLQRELTRGLNRAVLPLKRSLPESARAVLPRRGGLNERVATSLKTGLRRSDNRFGNGVRLVVKSAKLRELNRLDQGSVRHPVFQRPNQSRRDATWVVQAITPGWFTGPAEELAPQARVEAKAAIDAVAAQIDQAAS